jgi:hypothetical protein
MAVPNCGTLVFRVLTSLRLIDFPLSKLLNVNTLEEIPSLSNSFEHGLEDKTTFEIMLFAMLFINPNKMPYIGIINLLTQQ